MARVLILSSWVARGHVGLSAAAPVLQALGHVVTQLPTTILSNHPGFPNVAGAPIPVAQLQDMIAAMEANGWLEDHDAVLTGYLPTGDHVKLAAALLAKCRESQNKPRLIVDPVLGDDPNGLYLPEPVAAAIRDDLIPLAGELTPNSFELGWLSGQNVQTLKMAQDLASKILGKHHLQALHVTSSPAPAGKIATLTVTPQSTRHWQMPRRESVPHGVGDVFSALIAAGVSTSAALGHLTKMIDHSIGAPHLRIVETAALWTQATPISAIPNPET